MESRDDFSKDEALDAMRVVESARNRLTKRLTAPWWYKTGVALCVAAAFAGASLQFQGHESLGTSLLIVGAILAPLSLVSLAESRAGISSDRYKKELGWWWPISMIVLFVAAALIETRLDIPYALAAAGVIAFALTLVRENRHDSMIRRRTTTPRPEA